MFGKGNGFGNGGVGSGGGASAAAPDNSVQYNDGGSFGGSKNFTWNDKRVRVINTEDSGRVQVASFEGKRSTATRNDEVYVSHKIKDGAGNQEEIGRFLWEITTITDGSEDSRLKWWIKDAGSFVNRFQMDTDGISIDGGSTAISSTEFNLLDGMNAKSGIDQSFVTGTAGADGKIPSWNSDGDLTGNGDLEFDDTNGRLGVGGVSSISATVHIEGEGSTSSTSSFLAEDSGGNTLMKVEDGGNVGIGLDSLNARLEIKGGGNTESTNALIAKNSDGDRLLEVSNNGLIESGRLGNLDPQIRLNVGYNVNAFEVKNKNTGADVARLKTAGSGVGGGGQLALRSGSGDLNIRLTGDDIGIGSQFTNQIKSSGFVLAKPSTNVEKASSGVDIMDKDMALHQDNSNLTDNSTLNSQTLHFKGYYDSDATATINVTAKDATIQHIVEDTSPDSRLALSVGNSEILKLRNSGYVVQSVETSAIADGTLNNNEVAMYVDEGNTNIEFKWKDSGGTVRTGTVSMS